MIKKFSLLSIVLLVSQLMISVFAAKEIIKVKSNIYNSEPIKFENTIVGGKEVPIYARVYFVKDKGKPTFQALSVDEMLKQRGITFDSQEFINALTQEKGELQEAKRKGKVTNEYYTSLNASYDKLINDLKQDPERALSNSVKLLKNQTVAVLRPKRISGFDRDLVASYRDLPNTLTEGAYKEYGHINIGDMQGSNFEISDEFGNFINRDGVSVYGHKINIKKQ